MKKLFSIITAILLVLIYASPVHSQTNFQLQALFTPLYYSSAAWGDYNNDGMPDLLINGYDGSNSYTKIYRNNGNNTFTNIGSFMGLQSGCVSWCDYDNDGWMDFAVAGIQSSGNNKYLNLYKNTHASFNNMPLSGLMGVYNSSIAWGDYDNDGWTDLLVTGTDGTNNYTKLYRNDRNSNFIEQTWVNLIGVSSGSVDWGDYNNDGWLDILLTGSTGPSRVSAIYKNNGDGTFTEQTLISLTPVSSGCAVWGDYNNDGWLDILLTGDDGSVPVSKIYKNNGNNTFSEQTGISITGVKYSSAAWGDYNNDGNLDFIITGNNGTSPFTRIYRNNGNNTFTAQSGISLIQVQNGSAAWGDYNNDGKLDVLVTGYNGTAPLSYLYRNLCDTVNSGPLPPLNLQTMITNNDSTLTNSVKLSWNRTTDSITPQKSLSYNFYVIKKSCGIFNQTPMADTGSGFRRVVRSGNAEHDTTFTLQQLAGGTYQWGVQAIDNAFKGGGFANGDTFSISYSFKEIPDTSLPKYECEKMCWGDYNNDGWPDVIIYGLIGGNPSTKIFKNNGNKTFTEQTGIVFPAEVFSCIDWGDYDNDGWLDVMFSQPSGTNPGTRIFRNNGNNTFTELTGLGLPATTISLWGDINNDGWPDILMSGGGTTTVYRNNGNNTFSLQPGLGLPGISNNCAAWGDYDNDGYQDFILSGSYGGGQITKVFRNYGDFTFREQTGIVMTGLYNSSVAWGDYNNDGWLDILIQGNTGQGYAAKIYKNNGNNTFTELTGVHLTGLERGSVEWGDFNNDGLPDILQCGYSANSMEVRIYKNNGNDTFTEYPLLPLDGINYYWGNWVDYDNDGDLDIFAVGFVNGSTFTSKIFENKITTSNMLPSPPIGVTAFTYGNGKMFSWSRATDDHTPPGGLTYNVRIGTTPGSFDKVSPMADTGIGTRRVVSLGNACSDTGFIIQNLPPGTYYFSVQSIDNAYKGGSFTTEVPFETYPYFPQDSGVNIDHVYDGFVDWGDYDNDGWLDILLTGYDGYHNISEVYRNNGNGTFTKQTGISLYGMQKASGGWGDYNNDGWLDILLGGLNFTKVYKNNGNNTFTEQTGILLPGITTEGSAAWGDYNNDGWLDILLAGQSIVSPNIMAKVYKNNGNNTFTEQTSIVLTPVTKSNALWGDYNNDGWLDILLTGYTGTGYISKVYKNNGDNTFTEQTGIVLPGVLRGRIAWGDFNNDGWLDIILVSDSTGNAIVRMYKNNGDNTFTCQVRQYIISYYTNGNIAVGDFDNDGWLDVVIVGRTGPYDKTLAILRNNHNNTFSQPQGIKIAGADDGNIALGDYDNDGDLDILMIGLNIYGSLCGIYTNTMDSINRKPAAPSNLQASPFANEVTLSWSQATDDHTPQTALSYNVYMGTTPAGVNEVSPMANTSDGFRRVVRSGNTGDENTITIKNVPAGNYYWSVQAIDNAFRGSPFSPEFSIVVTSDENQVVSGERMSVYPNPATDNLIIQMHKDGLQDVSVSILNNQGELILRKPIQQSQTKIDISKLAPGLYFLEMVSSEEITVKKFIKE